MEIDKVRGAAGEGSSRVVPLRLEILWIQWRRAKQTAATGEPLNGVNHGKSSAR